MITASAYIPAADWAMAILWVAFAALAFTGLMRRDRGLKVLAVFVGALFVAVGSTTLTH